MNEWVSQGLNCVPSVKQTCHKGILWGGMSVKELYGTCCIDHRHGVKTTHNDPEPRGICTSLTHSVVFTNTWLQIC